MIGRGRESNRWVATMISRVVAGRGLGESDGGVFGVGEAAEGTHLGWKGGRGSEDRVGRGEVRLTGCLMDDHHVSGDVAGGEDVRRAGAKLSVHLNVAALGRSGRRRREG